jgi:hypothetical protein
MAKLINIAILSLLFLLSLVSTAKAHEGAIVDISKFGGKNGGCITEALTKAWNEACQSPTPSRVLIPRGSYRAGKVLLEGPCKASIEVEFKGTLKPTEDQITDDSWIQFNKITGFKLFGGGTFDGEGAKVWEKCKGGGLEKLPMSVKFNFITDGTIEDICSINAKQFHMAVVGCNNVDFNRLRITAPADSPNTDGIHIGQSTNIRVCDSTIGTGDDCISFLGGTKNVSITKVNCGPGHGISVGSLGRYQDEEPLTGITIKDCNFTNTDNGVRIKSWPDRYENAASDLHFEDLTMNNVTNPIIIDQNYCPGKSCAQGHSKVKLNKVFFKNIKGTSANPCAVKLACSSGTCEGVVLSEIDLSYNGQDGQVTSECSNVKPNVVGKMNPPACRAPVQIGDKGGGQGGSKDGENGKGGGEKKEKNDSGSKEL